MCCIAPAASSCKRRTNLCQKSEASASDPLQEPRFPLHYMSCKSRYDPTLEIGGFLHSTATQDRKKQAAGVKLFLLLANNSLSTISSLLTFLFPKDKCMPALILREREREGENVWPTIVLKLRKNRTKIN
jgi:hypothetical protein